MVNTRAKIYDAQKDEIEGMSVDTPPAAETLHGRRARWSALIRQQDYLAVITEVLEKELPRYTTSTVFNSSLVSTAMSECVLILASASEIFRAAVDGTLTQKYLRDTNLQTEYLTIQGRAYFQPSIYIHLLADKNGIPPTADQYLTIQQMVSRYIDDSAPDNALAFLIDNNSLPDFPSAGSIRGLRKYLCTHRAERSPDRVEALQRFCAGVRKRWTETPPQLRNSPLEFPPGECGYARNSHKRLAQHVKRQSSNYVLNLVEDICTHLYRTKQFSQRFYMHQYIIYLIFRPSQAEIAEIFCSGLLQVWVDNGGGFNHYPAGRSNRSARKVEDDVWNECERFAMQETGLVEKMRAQKDRLTKRVDADDLEEPQDPAARIWTDALEHVEKYRSAGF